MKISLYVNDDLMGVLNAMSGENGSTSGSMNAVLDRYRWVCKNSLPELSAEEWQALLNVYSGCEMSSYHPPYRIASDMMDDRGEIDIAVMEAADPEYAALVKKMHGMTQAQQMAVLDLCQRFWGAEHSGGTLTEIINNLKNWGNV